MPFEALNYVQKECPSKENLHLNQGTKRALSKRLGFVHGARNLYLIISQKQSRHDEMLFE